MPPEQPQAEQMADESMVRNLAAQAECIWPAERELFATYTLPSAAHILDIGCGTGEITARLAGELPGAHLIGIDLIEAHLDFARERYRDLNSRLEFRSGDAFSLDHADDSFDLTVCRHVLQAVSNPERIVAEMARTTRPGGTLHLLVEDYGMMHFPDWRNDLGDGDGSSDPDRFWIDGPITFAARTGTDLRIGRKIYGILRQLGLVDIRIDYIAIDPLRCPRDAFARIWEAWKDGYAEAIARETALPLDQVKAHFDGMLAAIRDDDGYALWQIPVASARVPSTSRPS